MKQIAIEVVFALPATQTILAVKVDEGSTIEQAIHASGILTMYPQIDLDQNKVGIWNKAKKRDDLVKANDRIEIYRPLIADPKESRKRRADNAKEQSRVKG